MALLGLQWIWQSGLASPPLPLLQTCKEVFQDLGAFLFYGTSIQAEVRVCLTEHWKEHVSTAAAAQITK